MRNTITKITAAISAAVLLALPTIGSMNANAEANPNARYTIRQVYYANPSAEITKIKYSFSCKKDRTDAPIITLIDSDLDYAGGGSAGDTYYNCGGTLTKNSGFFSGVVFSVSTYCSSPSALVKGSGNYTKGYSSSDVWVINSVNSSTFLVGDFDGNNKIDYTDLRLIQLVTSDNWTREELTSYVDDYNFCPAFKFDIDDNGTINMDDYRMFRKYYDGKLQRFAK